MKMSRELHHNECIARLPEYLSGTLRDDDAAAVAAHLEQCPRCREYLQLGQSLRRHFTRQQKMLASLQDPEREQDNFERLWNRIEADGAQGSSRAETQSAVAATVVARTHRFPCSQTRRPWRSLATIASGFLAAIIASQIAPLSPSVDLNAPHAQMAATRNTCDHLRVHFIDNLQRADLQQLLGAVNARVVAGPGQRGEYMLSATRPGQTLHQLQLHPAVVQAEADGC